MIIESTSTRTKNALAAKKIYTDADLARHFPRKYYDYRTAREIYESTPEAHCAVNGIIRSIERKSGARKYLSIKADMLTPAPNGRRSFTIQFFSRVYLHDRLMSLIGRQVVVMGRVCFDPVYGYTMPEPDKIVPVTEFRPHIASVYPKVAGVSDDTLRELIEMAVETAHEPFEWELMSKLGCTDYRSALARLHYPKSEQDIFDGRSRMLINDLLHFSIGLQKASAGGSAETDIRLTRRNAVERFVSSLPFTLTDDQQAILGSLCDKAASGERINALIQGDVGSGKTVIAIALMLLAAADGYQSVLMAPRTVLARQHYETLIALTGQPDLAVFLHSGLKASEKKAILSRIASGEVKLIVGTHSCIAKDVAYAKLGLVITDEEHLFGVNQKQDIIAKASAGVHTLSMSATPIPRTLAGVIYGEDREILRIHTMPAGRLPIKTAVESNRTRIFPFLLREIRSGHRCYVVCPAIDSNDETDIISIEEMEKAYRGYFEKENVTVAVATGRMDGKEAEAAIANFTSGRAQILLSTTVIEVGVNVPDATVIVIEQADRFGLASLHQLRGRVGRSDLQSYCILRSDDAANERLAVICSTTDGFKIAEADLMQRGTGNLLGLQQSGISRYVELMLANRAFYENEIKPVAKWCAENGFGERLAEIYRTEDSQ